jgi:hypothetical protein
MPPFYSLRRASCPELLPTLATAAGFLALPSPLRQGRFSELRAFGKPAAGVISQGFAPLPHPGAGEVLWASCIREACRRGDTMGFEAFPSCGLIKAGSKRPFNWEAKRQEIYLESSGRIDLKDTIVVVSGLPRSGTSMVMSMLEAGGLPLLKDGIRRADDDNPKGYYEFERVKKLREGDVDWLPDAKGKVVKIISYLLLNLPDSYTYRVIFVRRKLPEIIASQRKMLIRRGEDPDKVSEGELFEILSKHLDQVDAWIEDQPHVARIDIDYNQMIQNPQAGIERLNTFLGGSLELGKMAQVIDPNLYRQRK